ncbi:MULTISPECIES: DUF2806 domain-containing protein [unclassified Bradyrhizobium]|uniref:DUF2806 domain-containing protein n=1 Tax=unclassified Bradyrhizobium TaxID=2631580 RepID=UPI00291635E7|nr:MULTISPECIES: DUF2806 domain-containing protein [unclassified Bradyrhizobium]
MNEDHLDKETSVSVDLTPIGVKAKARSRFVAAFDRLCGNAVELLNIPMERRISRDRATIDGEKKVISAIVDYGLRRLKRDPQFAERVAEKHLEQIFGRQINKDGVMACAIEDLRHTQMTEDEAESGPEKLDPQFLGRLERYAEDASTEELRERWGRVLSAEIRSPGTFSPKVLRIVDELDVEAAHLFEEVCKSRLANVLPRSLVGDLPFDHVTLLSSAGLMVEPGLGQIRSFNSVTGSDGKSRWVLGLGEYALAFLADSNIDMKSLFLGAEAKNPLLFDENGVPAIPVYVLTNAGNAVAQILPNNRRIAFQELAKKLREHSPNIEFDMLEVESNKFRFFEI